MQRGWIASLLLVLGISVALASTAAGQEPEMVVDRPDQSESANVVPPGYVQLELGALWSRDDEDGVEIEGFAVPQTLARIGVIEDLLELRIGWGGSADFDVTTGGSTFSFSGVTDAEIGIKWRLRDRGKTSSAILVSTTVPVGDDELTSDEYEPAYRVAVERELTESLELGYNFGVFRENGETRYLYSAVLGAEMNDSLGVFFEVFGDFGDSGDAHSVDGGFTLLTRPNVQFDLAAGVGLSDAADDFFLGLGLTVRLPR